VGDLSFSLVTFFWVKPKESKPPEAAGEARSYMKNRFIFVKRKTMLRILCTFTILTLSSCKKPFDPAAEPVARPVSIHYLKTLYVNRPLRITDELTVEGRVVSSDTAGNFRWTLVVEDATGGIEVKVGLSPYGETYPVGQTVRVKCAGLRLGDYGRTIQLGGDSDDPGYETGFIDLERVSEKVIPVGMPEKILPTLLTPENLSMRWVDCAVRVEKVRFIHEEQGKTWGEEGAYTERRFLFTDSPTDTLAVRTAPDALFADEILPTEVISLEGVLTQFAGRYSLVLNGLP
jgi:hypothetical protein